MPASKKETKLIPALYKSFFEDIALFSWVEGQKRIIPTITIDQSISMFIDYVGGDDWDNDSLRSTYMRMQKKFYDAAKKV